MTPLALALARHQVTIRIASAQEQLEEQQRLQSRGWAAVVEWAWDYLAGKVNSLAARFFGTFAISAWYSTQDPFLFPMRMGGRVIHLSQHPEVIDTILQNPSSFCVPAGNSIEQTCREFFPQYTFSTEDLIMLSGQEAGREYRSLLDAFLERRSPRRIAPAVWPFIENTISRWGRAARGGECNLSIATREYTCEFLTRLILGPASASHELPWAMQILTFRLADHTVGRDSVSLQDLHAARDILGGVIARALSLSSPDAQGGHPTLIRVMREQGFPNERIAAMIVSLFVAGQATSSASLAYTLLKCAQDQDLQESIRGKIIEMQCQGMTVEEASLHAPILQRVIAESLRMMPPVPMIRRALRADAIVLISGATPHRYYLRAGSEIGLLPGCLAKNRIFFGSDATSFRPGRHDPARASFLPQLEWRPFGVGPHRCPGWAFFQLGTTWLISELIRNYQLSTSCTGEPKQYCAYTNGPKHDLFIRLALR